MDSILLKRIIQTLCVGLMIVMIWAPTIQERLNPMDLTALNENRFRTPRPTDWKALFAEGAPFTRHYEKYFNDTFGFRDLLIRIKHQADYSLFGESDEIVVGRDGWLFYRDVLQQQYYLAQMSEDTFQRIIQRTEILRAALAARGMKLVFLATPSNDKLYPEMLPSQSLVPPSPTRADRYREYLRTHSEFVFVDATELLFALKKRFRVFHKTDFHWTDPAGAYTAKEVIDTLGQQTGLGPLWNQPIELEVAQKKDGGEMSAMGLLWPRAEEGLFLRQAGIRKPNGRLISTNSANEWVYESDEPDDAKLIPPTVIFGDSFADAFERAGWLVYFRRLQKFYNWELTKNYKRIPPETRFVILQFGDGHLNGFANDDYWPEEVLGATAQMAQLHAGEPASLSAEPNPVPLCDETGYGATTVAWTAPGARAIEIRLGAPDGTLWVLGGSAGRAKTGQWVGKGMTFYLQNTTDNAPLDSKHTLASLTIKVARGGACP